MLQLAFQDAFVAIRIIHGTLLAMLRSFEPQLMLFQAKLTEKLYLAFKKKNYIYLRLDVYHEPRH